MFKCPSCLEQHGATCLIQSMQFACCVLPVRWKEKLLYLFTNPHVPKLCPFTPPLITLRTFLREAMQVYSQFITLHDSGKRKCHLGALLMSPISFFISWGESRTCKSQARWENFTSARASYYPQVGIITCTGYRVPLSPTLYIIRSDQPIYTAGIWQEVSERSGMIFCVCMWERVARLNMRGVGESNLSHRGAETGRKMRCRPRITPAVSMNEMTGLQGY